MSQLVSARESITKIFCWLIFIVKAGAQPLPVTTILGTVVKIDQHQNIWSDCMKLLS